MLVYICLSLIGVLCFTQMYTISHVKYTFT